MLSTFVQAGKENAVVPVSLQDVIHSKVLQEMRSYMVHLPRGYGNSEHRYPVFYLLDAEQGNYFQQTIKTIESLSNHGKIPEMIVVGIKNTNRLRDMNIPEFIYRDEIIVGGANNFLSFLKNELMSVIDKKYRTTHFNVLSGRSASATFSIFTMISEPNLFNAIIASSPSFYVNEKIIITKTRALFKNRKYFDPIFFMNLGTEDSKKRIEQTKHYTKLLKNIAPSNFKWEMRVMEGEGHVPETSNLDGLLMIFSNGT